MPTARVMELLEDMAEHGVWQVNLCGGDPAVHPDFVEIVAKARALDMIVDVSTKAYISPEDARRLKQAGLDYIQVSIEAANEELGDQIYGRKGQFAKVNKTIQNLVNAGVYTRTNSIITTLSFPHLEEIIHHLRDLGIREMKFSPAFRSMYVDSDPYLLGTDDIRQFEQEMARLADKYRPDGLQILSSTMPDPTRMTDEERSKYWLQDRAMCSSGRSSLIINPDGDVTICEEAPQEGDFVVGSVRDAPLETVWNSDKMMALAFPTRERFAGTPCETCDQFDICVGQKGHCFKDSYKGYGNPFTTNPFCPNAAESRPRLY